MNVVPTARAPAWTIAPIASALAEAGRAARWGLTAGEQRELAGFRDRRRRDAYQAGRWVAKHLAGRLLDVPPHEFEIRSRSPDGRRGVRPVVFHGGRPKPIALSIAHTATVVCAAASMAAETTVGIDLVEQQTQLSGGFRTAWFSADERAAFEGRDGGAWTRGWCVKEAVFKAAPFEAGFAPRQIECWDVPGGTPRLRYGGVELGDAIQVQVFRWFNHWAAIAVCQTALINRRRMGSALHSGCISGVLA